MPLMNHHRDNGYVSLTLHVQMHINYYRVKTLLENTCSRSIFDSGGFGRTDLKTGRVSTGRRQILRSGTDMARGIGR